MFNFALHFWVQGLNMLKSSITPYLLLLFAVCFCACQRQEATVDFEQYLKQQWQLNTAEREAFLKEAYSLADSLQSTDGMIRSQFFIGYHYETTHRHALADSSYRLLLKITQAYNNPEWEVSGLIQLGQVLVFKRSFEEADLVLNEALEKAPRQANAGLEGFVYSTFGLLYDRQSQVKEAIGAYTKALAVFRREKNQSMELLMLNYLGIQHAALGLYDLSSQYYVEAASVALQKQDTAQYISAIYQSGINLIENRDYQEAINLGVKALALQKRSTDEAKYARILNNLGNAYTGMYRAYGQKIYADSAVSYINRSLNIKREMGDKRGLTYSIFYLGRIMEVLNDARAEKYYQEAYDYWSAANDEVNLAKVCLALSTFYSTKAPVKAASFLERASQANEATGNLKEQIDILEARIRLQSQSVMNGRLGPLLSERDSLSQAFASLEKEKSVAATEVRLQTAELSFENEELANEKAYQEEVAELRKWLIVGVLIALLAALVLLFLIRLRNRQLDKVNTRIRNLKDTVLHSQANSINLVSALIRLQTRTLTSGKEKALLEQVNGRVSALGGITQLLYEEQFDRDGGTAAVDLKDYLEEIVRETLTSLPAEGVHVEVQLISAELSSNKALSLGLIVNEWIINFFKHARSAGADHFSLNSELSGDHLVISYHDNGPGLKEKTPEKKNFGSFMIDNLVSDLQGSLEVLSDKGLYYHIKVPR